MKIRTLLLLFALSPIVGISQSSTVNPTNACINCTTDADNSAVLDIRSTSKGILIPRMTANQRDAIINPEVGLLIYCTDHDLFYYWTGADWMPSMGTATAVDSSVLNNAGDQLIQPSTPNSNLIVGSNAGLNIDSSGAPTYNGWWNTFIG